MSKGMIKIDTVVREALADKGYDTPHLYARFLLYALRFFREMNIDRTQDIKTVELPVSVIKTVAYPEDYIAYNKLGVKIGDRFLGFARDNTITNHHIDRYTANTPFVSEAQTLRFYNYYENPNLQGTTNGYNGTYERFGYAHNGVGYFKPNNECKEFQLSAEITSNTVLLEYIYDNFNPDTETFVTHSMRDVMRKYIHYQYSVFVNGGSLGQRREDEVDFLDALSTYDKRLSDLSFETIMDSLRRSTTLSVKG